MTVRTRFAPSPTGFLHIGGVRTALFNWLFARSQGGQFILRIDDTDQSRNVEEAVRLILDGFRWIGIDWDEGPEVGGPVGPYFQSQRGDLYHRALQHLLDQGLVYKDFSTEDERAADKAAAEARKQPYRFRRKPIDPATLAQFEAEGRPYALRFKVPLGRTLVLEDRIKGRVEQRTDDLSDFVVARPDGSPLYNFASAVDDLEMGITHVIRAEEHLTNTFSQLLIFEALRGERPMPSFAHVPFVAKPGSKVKLSKRDGAVGLDFYIEAGYLPEAMMNYLARLGWSFDDKQEIFSRAELIEKFTLERVNSSPASHDPDKLFWIQGEWMRTLSLEAKRNGVLPYLQRAGLISEPPTLDDLTRLDRVILALQDRLKVFSDILKLGRFFFEPIERFTIDPEAGKKRLRKEFTATLLEALDDLLATTEPFDEATLEKAVHDLSEARGLKIGDVVNTLRVAVTGQGIGPGLYDCLTILGREGCRQRLAKARQWVAS